MARDWQSTKHGTNIIMEHLLGTANRGSVSTVTAYSIDNSICFLDNVNGTDSSDYLKPTNDWAYAYPGGPVSHEYTSLTTATLSFWMKRGQSSASIEGICSGFSSARYGAIFLQATTNKLTFSHPLANQAPTSNMTLNDYSAWYHMVLALDTSSGTASERERFYINGVEVTWATAPDWDEDQTFSIFSHSPSWLVIGAGGHYGNNDENSFTGYLAEWHFVDGQQLAPTEFGEVNDDGIWIPKEYDGTYGGTGHYLKFGDADNLGTDENVHSGAGGALTYDEIGLTTQNQSTDTPTNNFCTLNPLWEFNNNGTSRVGNLRHTGADSVWSGNKATMGVDTGKWYWEVKCTDANNIQIGVQTDGEDDYSTGNPNSNKSTAHIMMDGSGSDGRNYTYFSSGTKTSSSANTYAAWTADDICGVALNMDDNEISFYKNGSDYAIGLDLFDNADKINFPFIASYAEDGYHNFGGTNSFSISSGNADGNGYGNFEYAVPSGYYALCTKNLATYG